MTDQPSDQQLIADNRKARHDYHLFDTYEAGVVLLGTEVKSIREGRVNLKDAYGRIERGEVFLPQRAHQPLQSPGLCHP